MVTKVRRRRVWELHARRGRNIDTPYKYRTLLVCAADRLSVRQRARLQQILAEDIELAVAWGSRNTSANCSPPATPPRSSASGPGSNGP